MRTIETFNGISVQIDDSDFRKLNEYKWHITYKAGIVHFVSNQFGKRLTRILLDYNGKLEIDHKDRNPLNCQRSNLRLATRSQNNMNKVKYNMTLSTPTDYKGVGFNKKAKKWIARIQCNGNRLHLGYFLTDEAAAKAYDKKAKELHGEFAVLNFPE